MSNLNSDEFETIIELIVCVIFMAFGAWSMSRMVSNLSERVDVLEQVDKIQISSTEHEVEDPFYFTGYQAYMFGWHMDAMSYEDLHWVGGSVDENPPHMIDDDSDREHVGIGVIKDGEIMSQFYTWRNQMITGAGQGTTRSVKNTIASVVPPNLLKNLYRGKLDTFFHLELTGDYSISNDLGDDPNTGGKTFKWILIPRKK